MSDWTEAERELFGRIKWLVRFRWFSVVIILLMASIPRLLGYAATPPVAYVTLLPWALGYNIVFWYLNRRLKGGAAISRTRLWYYANLQVLCDTTSLVALVYITGTVESPITFFLLFGVVFSGLILRGYASYLHGNIAAVLFVFLAVGEYLGIIPHIQFLKEGYFGQSLYNQAPNVLASVLLVTASLNFTAFLTSELARRLDRVSSDLRDLLGRLRREVLTTTLHVASSAEQLSASTQEITAGATHIAVNTQELAHGAEVQTGQLEVASQALNELSALAERTVERADAVARSAAQSVEAAQTGQQSIETGDVAMTDLSSTVQQISRAVARLGERSQAISEIADTIQKFADQTDLLALNASIEAARAGPYGRSFAVVADSVRKLAESSAASATHITTLVDEIQGDITNADLVMHEGIEQLTTGTAELGLTRVALSEILETVVAADEHAQDMFRDIGRQYSASQRLVIAINQVATVAEDTARRAAMLAAAVQEQTAALEEIGAATRELADVAARLESAVGQLTE